MVARRILELFGLKHQFFCLNYILFQRLCAENERKLKTLSTRIQEHNREAVAPVKKTLLADPQAPREVRRRQKRFGTGHVTQPLPSASEISKARKEIFCKGLICKKFDSIFRTIMYLQ